MNFKEGIKMYNINVTKSSMPEFEEYVEKIKTIFENRHLTNMGPLHNELKEKLAHYMKVKNISLFTNGHIALESVLSALKLEGEVITTPFTFASTTQAIVRCGLTPVFCDVNEEDYTIDADKIEELITDKTCAIVPVHVYGNVCDVERINEIAEKYNLKVIYDAAHVFGVEYKGRGIGDYGDASMFSFHATKVFNTIEGGCVTYKDEKLSKELRMQKNFGMENQESYPEIAGNGKMNEFQAAMGLCNLKHIDGEIAKRKAVAKRYMENLKADGIKVWKEQENVLHNYAYFPVVFDKEKFGKNRDEVADILAKENIFSRKYFYPITSEFECFKGKFEINETPVAKKVSENVLCLPMYADLALDDVDRICNIILGGRL